MFEKICFIVMLLRNAICYIFHLASIVNADIHKSSSASKDAVCHKSMMACLCG